MSYERMLDKDHQPTDREILKTICDTAPWFELKQYIE